MHKYRQNKYSKNYTKKYRKKYSKKKKQCSRKKLVRSVHSSRKYHKGGLNKQNYSDKIDDLKHIIATYKDNEASDPNTFKRNRIAESLNFYTKNISTKANEELNDDDLALIQELVMHIMDDSYGISILTKSIAQLQKAINAVVLYFINDIEVNENVDFILKKRITNNTPYLDVIRKKDGHETTYDVNEMFSLLRSELNSADYDKNLKKSFLKRLTIDSTFGLEEVKLKPASAS